MDIEYSNKNKYFDELINRQKILIELEKDFEGDINSVKSILKERENNFNFSGIYGAIGELIKLDKKYETAIEVALGGSIQNIITKTEDDAKMAIKYLKDNKKGRATFLPISSMEIKEIEGEISSLKKELLNFEDEMEKVNKFKDFKLDKINNLKL